MQINAIIVYQHVHNRYLQTFSFLQPITYGRITFFFQLGVYL